MLGQGEAVEDFTQLSRERLEHTFNVNIIGMIRLAQEVVEHMPAGGSIINVSPVSFRGAHLAAESAKRKAVLSALAPRLASLAALCSCLALLERAAEGYVWKWTSLNKKSSRAHFHMHAVLYNLISCEAGASVR